MADTTTTLNPGTGGDKMDESQVLQSDGTTSAKRPRVVIGGDAGYGTVNDLVQPVATDPGKNAMALPTVPMAVVSETPNAYVDGETRPLSLNTDGRLRVVVVRAPDYLDMFGDTRCLATDPNEFVMFNNNNPWGM